MRISLDQEPGLFFIVCPNGGLPNSIRTKGWKLALTLHGALKHRRRTGTSLPVSFSVWFLKKSTSHLYVINWPNFIAWLPLVIDILGNTGFSK